MSLNIEKVITSAPVKREAKILPLELMDTAINHKVLVLLKKSESEYTGYLKGFDDQFNLILDEVTEIVFDSEGKVI